ncbi:MAG: hypothetical protein EHM33_22380 [Chloroflexi bacterium]|nr:MAG: hypothetical protein EHM33_22380 [Chloroflexota bacterium]
MITDISSHASHSGYGKENHLAIRATTELKKQGNAILSRGRILKWFGILSTVLIGAAALAPDALGIPLDLHPWVFLASIFWLFAFCAGLFDQ